MTDVDSDGASGGGRGEEGADKGFFDGQCGVFGDVNDGRLGIVHLGDADFADQVGKLVLGVAGLLVGIVGVLLGLGRANEGVEEVVEDLLGVGRSGTGLGVALDEDRLRSLRIWAGRQFLCLVQRYTWLFPGELLMPVSFLFRNVTGPWVFRKYQSTGFFPAGISRVRSVGL